jgi:hypothetical protein
MDYQAVASPTNYGAPSVSGILNPQQQGQQGQQQGQQQGAQQQQNPVAAALAKAKQLLSSGQMSADQYTSLTSQLSGMAGNMGSTMPGSPGAAQPGAPMNITPPVAGG